MRPDDAWNIFLETGEPLAYMMFTAATEKLKPQEGLGEKKKTDENPDPILKVWS